MHVCCQFRQIGTIRDRYSIALLCCWSWSRKHPTPILHDSLKCCQEQCCHGVRIVNASSGCHEGSGSVVIVSILCFICVQCELVNRSNLGRLVAEISVDTLARGVVVAGIICNSADVDTQLNCDVCSGSWIDTNTGEAFLLYACVHACGNFADTCTQFC